ncbi:MULTISPECIES: nitroreductase family deazaflavin-dependent oxidoreductase [Streptomyces]|uniref:nitroreductase family deazaflavin-dependent oxidoreductase n=1 Tax=Streptomyces TaxID=1883 RepID=UPI001E4BB9D5|nr:MULTISPECIES: nitroreductase family deazaflavin-dependent oxidoreductase [Streptomyces]UFQ16300.1 nitroreductase family deazaflavin-dependent oxidoreductase [Streptomyces huasconensis]WCL85904.1 nitroreductase family deazaflavin-dependent oxidoreductase [Streptomyces sp. JCM 35825]
MPPNPRPARTAAGLRLVQKVSATRAFAKLAPHVVPALDRAVHRLTRGKVLLSGKMLPGLVLTTRGAKSGLPRRTPLACVPDEKGGGWVLIGSNFGRPGHPAWTANLLAHPEASVNWRGADVPVRARLLTGEERAAAWEAALAFWPPYAAYQSRVEREIRLFRLERRPRRRTT